MKKTFTKNQLPDIAIELVQKAQTIRSGTAAIIALSGDLGAGKTTLTQEIARVLGIKEHIISPTFVIMKSYLLKGPWKKMIHIDAYRLESSQELMRLGWEEMAKNPENLIIVEWPERVPECLDSGVYRVMLEHVDEETRTIEILL